VNASDPLSPGGFARFYAPLAATSLLLTATNPLLTAALARTPNPAAALAGYAVAFALCGVLYSPLLVVQQVAATRLLEGRGVDPVRRFALVTGVVFSALAAAVAFTPLGEVVFHGAIGVRGNVYLEARDAMSLLWPVPLLTGVRATHQGRLVAGHRTHPIAAATGLRTGVLALVAFGLTWVAAGAWLGGAAFTAGLIAEALVVGFSRAPAPYREDADDTTMLEAGLEDPDDLLRFSAPLMLNVLLWWSTPLILDAVLARTPEPELALAAFAVVEAAAWFVTAPVGQFQHASIALVQDPGSYRKTRVWTGTIAVAVFAVLVLLALPGIREWHLDLVFSLDAELLRHAAAALPVAVLYPLLYGHRQYYQGLFIRVGCPDVVARGALLRVGVVVTASILLAGPLGHLGAALGVGIHAGGIGVEDFYLERRSHQRVIPVLEEEGAPASEAAAGTG